MNLTPQRRDQAFLSAQNWAQFVDSMTVNRSTIEANYAGYELTPSDKQLLSTLPGVTDVLVLAHDWCGDVVANLPLFAKIEAETGKIRLHIVPKDPDNVDIGRLYPHPDGDVHIPVYVFFDANGQEKGHFIERTTELTKEVGRIVNEFWANNPHIEGKGQEFSSLKPEVKATLLENLTSERQRLRELEKGTIMAMLQETLLS